jgi:hypothetical protein
MLKGAETDNSNAIAHSTAFLLCSVQNGIRHTVLAGSLQVEKTYPKPVERYASAGINLQLTAVRR